MYFTNFYLFSFTITNTQAVKPFEKGLDVMGKCFEIFTRKKNNKHMFNMKLLRKNTKQYFFGFITAK
jgi:hypothetical protein